MALTDTEIRKSKPTEKPYRLFDGGGLYVQIAPTGGKLWRWKYRFQGAEKLMAFGKYPAVSLADARVERDKARKVLSTGIDPMAQRRIQKTAFLGATEHTFQKVADRWFEHWKADKTKQHHETTMGRLKRNVIPAIGHRPISAIEPMELVAMAKAIEERGAADIARRALQTTKQIFRYAVAHGIIPRNTAAEIFPSDILKRTRQKNLARIPANELPDLLQAIEVYQGTHTTRLAMKLMALTFVRTSELIGARWEEFDLASRRWNIPAERMKMETPHIVPLARQTLEILGLLRSITGREELLFPGALNPKKPISNNTILGALKRMGYGGRMTGHGFRGIASTILHEQGYNHEHIELQLAHAPRNDVSAAYNHALYLEPRAKMMQDWADILENTQRRGKVLNFRTA
jgi:integrase